MKNILDKIKYQKLLQRYAMLTVSLLISAVVYNVFIRPANIVTGGTNGIAVITENLFGINPSLMIFLLCAFLLIFSFIFLGTEETIAALYITIVYPVLVELTSVLINYVNIEKSALLATIIFGGIIGGIANGIVYKTGFNTGGIGIISKILYKYKKIAITTCSFIINIIIVCCGGLVFGFNMILYAAVYLFISNLVSERILLGVSRNKVFYIISKEYKKIGSFIIDELNHDITTFTTKGKFLEKRQKVIMVVVPTKEYFLVKESVKEIDNNAFIIVTDGYETKGADIEINRKNKNKKRLDFGI